MALVAALLLGACAGQPRDFIDLTAPGDNPTGHSSAPTPVVGTWQADIVVTVDTDVQEWVTTWQFDQGGTCHFQRTTTSISVGVPQTVARDCTYTVGQSSIEVTYTDTGDTASLPYSFPDTGNTTLTLEGVDYTRLG